MSAEAVEHLDFAIREFQEMRMQPSQRGLRVKRAAECDRL